MILVIIIDKHSKLYTKIYHSFVTDLLVFFIKISSMFLNCWNLGIMSILWSYFIINRYEKTLCNEINVFILCTKPLSSNLIQMEYDFFVNLQHRWNFLGNRFCRRIKFKDSLLVSKVTTWQKNNNLEFNRFNGTTIICNTHIYSICDGVY